MLLSTNQMSYVHSLDKNRPAITISDSTLEYVNVSKLLGVHFHQHLNGDEHIQATCKSCYGTIQTIRKLKNFAGYRLRKHLVESLVLSKLDYQARSWGLRRGVRTDKQREILRAPKAPASRDFLGQTAPPENVEI